MVVQGLEAASWPDAFEAIKKGLEGAKRNQIAAIAGKLADGGFEGPPPILSLPPVAYTCTHSP
jgi:hypothetical protein